MSDLSFWVPGIPQPQGSTKSFRGRGRAAHRIITTSDNDELRPWRNAVTWQAQSHRVALGVGPVHLGLTFYLPRPKGHFGKAGNLLPSAPRYHTVKPDLSKLVRAIEDSLTDAGVWRDDNQVAITHSSKNYADSLPPGVEIRVTLMVPVHAPPPGVSAHEPEISSGIR